MVLRSLSAFSNRDFENFKNDRGQYKYKYKHNRSFEISVRNNFVPYIYCLLFQNQESE